MNEEDAEKVLLESYENLPHFSDGRINYDNAEEVPTVAVFLKHENQILLLKRSSEVKTHKNRWCIVAGYLDELTSATKKALKEVREETGIRKDKIVYIKKGETFKFNDEGKTWISHPFLIELEEKPRIEIDWEHVNYKWFGLKKAKELLPGFLIKILEKMNSSSGERKLNRNDIDDI